MSDEPKEISTALVVAQEIEVESPASTAVNVDEIPHMQASLVVWARGKVLAVAREAEELKAAWMQAVKNKWQTATLKRHAAMAQKRVVYYQKILAALEAGYCIFPTVDCEIFAIRTGKATPKWGREFVQFGGPNFEEKAQMLEAGEGRYVEPVPLTDATPGVRTDKRHDGSTYEVHGQRFEPTEFDEVEFPLIMAKPHIMDVAGRAMALKIFDEIGIIGDTGRARSARRGQDPVIIGRIIDPTPPGYGRRKRITFLIAWHVDTKDL